ncbi:MAG: DUF11 domain-containing protein [Rhizobiales bacterium]|nr:DUF11 domain-containing protein [Hyphomicrobiales bacterium]
MFAKPIVPRLVAGLSALFIVLAVQAHATTSVADSPVESSLEAFLVEVSSEGTEQFGPARNVDPGDVIEYRIAHHNTSAGSLSGFIVAGPIPAGTTFVAGSATGAPGDVFEVLVDGEDWQALPAFKTVRNEDGTERRVEALPEDYRSIRWRLAEPLAEGASTANAYRVQVSE